MSAHGSNERLRLLLTEMVKGLVDDEGAAEVGVAASDGGNMMVLTVRVAERDVGKIIGKQGRTAHALRMVVEAVAAKHKQRAVLEIVDDKRNMRGRSE